MRITTVIKVETEIASALNNDAIVTLANAQKDILESNKLGGESFVSCTAQVVSCEATKAIKV